MTFDQVMSELAAKGSESVKKIFAKHGAKEPFFGVKIADLKVVQKRIKDEQALALKLFATGNGDAQYLAGLIADGAKMTAAQLEAWVKSASWVMISKTIVPWVASEHSDGLALALKWIESPQEGVAVSGWSTLNALATITPDDRLPIEQFSGLLDRVAKTLPRAPNDVRAAMNAFVVTCGTYVAALGEKAIATARILGKVDVDLGEMACEVPDAERSILKRRRGEGVAPKRRTMRC